MSRGRKQPLVEAILLGSFRPDRQGRLLLEEPLPEECPLEEVSSAGARAWRDLISAQAAYRDSGAPNPWAFATLVRQFHGALRQGSTVDSLERFRVDSALRIGPYPACPDDLLERHWQEWASLEEWNDPTDYAYWRFRKGLAKEAALAKAKKARDEQHEKWMLERIRECNIKDWDPFFLGKPLAERRRLIRKAGRPDLIDAKGCERFGITEETWPSAGADRAN